MTYAPIDAAPTRAPRPPAPPRRTDDAAFTELVRVHRAGLLAYTTRLTGGDRGRAEDVVQETLLRAWHHLDRLTPEQGSVHGWLRRVAHNLAVDGHRARRSRPAELELAAEHTDVATTPDHAEGVAMSTAVQGLLGRIWLEHRTAVTEIYLRDLTCAQAAAVLGVPEGTVKSRVHYALRSLRRQAECAELRRAG
ncbi:sigma-70 family RNA polymerase sigma factor [Frankia sp. AgB32]|uniref:sigma-70 family RNA polymerase sigma factor n=1 Tax=Frankia sp. AgB32 TaxID=631119 RepID=UPI00200C0C02|nr:sigma-70 family RNA polymerase sigma factor [Frankia sp. AgB32]MCK9896347.1 sigma-70 family RNA polymerase sigma factor [Frankia sp. AgB32]